MTFYVFIRRAAISDREKRVEKESKRTRWSGEGGNASVKARLLKLTYNPVLNALFKPSWIYFIRFPRAFLLFYFSFRFIRIFHVLFCPRVCKKNASCLFLATFLLYLFFPKRLMPNIYLWEVKKKKTAVVFQLSPKSPMPRYLPSTNVYYKIIDDNRHFGFIFKFLIGKENGQRLRWIKENVSIKTSKYLNQLWSCPTNMIA